MKPLFENDNENKNNIFKSFTHKISRKFNKTQKDKTCLDRFTHWNEKRDWEWKAGLKFISNQLRISWNFISFQLKKKLVNG